MRGAARSISKTRRRGVPRRGFRFARPS